MRGCLIKKINLIKTEIAQVTLEFTFAMIIALLLMYACIRAFGWTASDLALRRDAHERRLTQPVKEDWKGLDSNSPLWQIEPGFYRGARMNLVWNGW